MSLIKNRLISLTPINLLSIWPWFVAGLIAMGFFALGGLFAMRLLRQPSPASILPGQELTYFIIETIYKNPETLLVSGSYIPQTGILLYSQVALDSKQGVQAWTASQLEQLKEDLNLFNKQENLVWIIDYGPSQSKQEIMQVALTQLKDSSHYEYRKGLAFSFRQLKDLTEPAQADTQLALNEEAATPTAPASLESEHNLSPEADPLRVDNQPKPSLELAPPSIQTGRETPSSGGSILPGQAFTALSENLVLYQSSFDSADDIKKLRYLSGQWSMLDNTYQQLDNQGFDYIVALNTPPQSHYHLEASLRSLDANLGGGFVYNMPYADQRLGGQVLDFVEQGSFLRWGRYDEIGQYIYEGGMAINPPIADGDWHQLSLVTQAEVSQVSLDGQALVQIPNLSPGGYVGLVSSQAQVAFDDIQFTALSTNPSTMPMIQNAPRLLAGSAEPSPLNLQERFSDNFADDRPDGWRVLDGNWQVIDQAYHQKSTTEFDLASISSFQGENYSLQVRFRYLTGDMGAGLIFNMANRLSRAESQVLGFINQGKALQWGYFDEGGNFIYQDQVETQDVSDGAWHVLRLDVNAGQGQLWLDGVLLEAAIPLAYVRGYMGLLVSTSYIVFDEVSITPLDEFIPLIISAIELQPKPETATITASLEISPTEGLSTSLPFSVSETISPTQVLEDP